MWLGQAINAVDSNKKNVTPKLKQLVYMAQVYNQLCRTVLYALKDEELELRIMELEEKLKGFLDGRDVENLYRGQVKSNKETLAVFRADEDMDKTIDAWIDKRKYAKLLDLWVKGLVFDWTKLYGDTKPRRISLPTYPFARERCWVPEDSGQKTDDIKQKANFLFYQRDWQSIF